MRRRRTREDEAAAVPENARHGGRALRRLTALLPSRSVVPGPVPGLAAARALPRLARPAPRRLALAAVLGFGAALAATGEQGAAGATGALTAEEARGRAIYRTGEAPGGPPITATLGGSETPLPATALPCAGCHGADGRGRPEGGVVPTDVTWPALTRPYEVTARGGRRRGPYDRRLLVRAVTLGLDAAGNRLDDAMPRYRLAAPDAEALAAYLLRLGSEPEPGVGERVLRIGALLPADARRRAPAAGVEAALRAVLAETNTAGGLYGRRLELRVARTAGDAADHRRALAELLSGDGVVAVVAPLALGADAEQAAAAEAEALPLIGAAAPAARPPSPRGVAFYLLAGLAEEARVLWDFAAGRAGPGRVAVVAPEERAAPAAPERKGEPAASASPAGGGEPGRVEGALTAVRAQARRWGVEEPPIVRYPAAATVLACAAAAAVSSGATAEGAARPPAVSSRPGTGDAAGERSAAALAARLRPYAAVVWLGPGEDAACLRAALAAAGHRPDLLLPGAFTPPLTSSGAAGGGRLFASFPLLPWDATSGPALSWRSFAARHGLPAEPPAAQRLAAAAARLLVEAVGRAGRELTRERLVQSLAALHRFDTGLLPPLAFAPTRRIGALGAHVVELDAATGAPLSVSGWIEPR